jgi:hypothetical protein
VTVSRTLPSTLHVHNNDRLQLRSAHVVLNIVVLDVGSLWNVAKRSQADEEVESTIGAGWTKEGSLCRSSGHCFPPLGAAFLPKRAVTSAFEFLRYSLVQSWLPCSLHSVLVSIVANYVTMLEKSMNCGAEFVKRSVKRDDIEKCDSSISRLICMLYRLTTRIRVSRYQMI